MAHKSPYNRQHAPTKDSELVSVKRAMALQMRKIRLLKEAGLDMDKKFPTEEQQLEYTKRIEDVLKGV